MLSYLLFQWASCLRRFALLLTVLIIPASFSVAADDDYLRSDFAPSFSPDGNQVVYYSYRGRPSDFPDLYIYDVRTGVERQLTNTADQWEIEPVWLPDGDLIQFAGGPSMAELSTQVIKPDGNGRRSVSYGRGEGPAYWSPDGRFLTMRTPYGDNGVSQLMIYDPSTEATHTIETGLPGQNTIPSWSPDGQHLVFSHKPLGQERGGELYRININGGEADRLTHNNMEEYKTSWSPDGKAIFFMANEHNGPSHIYRVSAFGGAAVRMTSDNNSPAYFPEVSADGTTVYFSGLNAKGETRIMALPANARQQQALEIEDMVEQRSINEERSNDR
ncbi:TolB family protein [Kordiimonas aquimaris]|uniref:TolB family protein n=1 Tax=Kordiimonas aquimaris TaxID=707591 RepID=UPI0021CF92B2|nr:hypothetical protein [Kordiimonas aquimaris]